MPEYNGDYELLATQSEEHPETGELTRTVEVRRYDSGVAIVNIVLTEHDDSDEYDYLTTDDGGVIVADMTEEQFSEVTEALDAVFVRQDAGEGVRAPEGDGWEVGQHPLFGQIIFQRTDDYSGHVVIQPDNIEAFTQELLDAQAASA